MNVSTMSLHDWLDDLCVRFIVNLPKEELESIERICFQIEEAQWFYEDFVRPLDSQLPSLNLKQFCMLIFQQCSLFSGWDQELYTQAFAEFLTYKTRVPVRGAIMLNEAMDQCVLVKGWKKSANWSFPRGKINKGEADLACAIREVYEETGFDIREAGLVPQDEPEVKSIEITMREQHMKLFVFHGVPMDTYFQPRTRKEISSIQWYRLSDLPTIKKASKQQQQAQDGYGDNLAMHANKFYMVAPFMPHLKKYIGSVRKRNATRQPAGMQPAYPQDLVVAETQDNNPNIHHTEAIHVMEATLAPNANDMDRLMSQLRQSSQASREQNFPEVLAASQTPDASAQLRAVLNVPQRPTSALPETQTLPKSHQQGVIDELSFRQSTPGSIASGVFGVSQSSRADHAASQGAFGAVQRGPVAGQTNQPNQPNYSDGRWQEPQTPLDQIFGPSQTPSSPKHHHRPHQPAANMANAAPPTFPHSPMEVVSSQIPIQPSRPESSTPAQSLWPDGAALQHTSRARSPAPYQQSSDPVLGEPQQNDPTVPEPSRLPLPKLNANSAKLLSLFRPASSGITAEMSGDSLRKTELAEAQPYSTAIGGQAAIANTNLQNRVPPPPTILTEGNVIYTAAVTSPTEMGTTSPVASRPRTAQQTTLLDLFRSQPTRNSSGAGRTSGTLSPALAPAPSGVIPQIPLELSSASSPGGMPATTADRHRSTSREALAPAPSVGGRIKIQKRPTGHTPHPSMSATVSGPLQVSETDFQKLNQPTLKPGNVKILSRPDPSSASSLIPSNVPSNVPALVKGSEGSSKTASPKGGRSQRRRPDSRQGQSPSKPFQPQILKRPSNASNVDASKELQISTPAISIPQVLRREGELPSPMSRQTSGGTAFEPVSAATPAPTEAIFSQSSSQTSEQKTMLLSLFQKSPGPPAVSPINSLPRTRLGSLASNGSGEAGRSTPQTSDKDRKFLLGFLNNVVNESR